MSCDAGPKTPDGHADLSVSLFIIGLAIEDHKRAGGNPIDHSHNTHERGHRGDQIGDCSRHAGPRAQRPGARCRLRNAIQVRRSRRRIPSPADRRTCQRSAIQPWDGHVLSRAQAVWLRRRRSSINEPIASPPSATTGMTKRALRIVPPHCRSDGKSTAAGNLNHLSRPGGSCLAGWRAARNSRWGEFHHDHNT